MDRSHPRSRRITAMCLPNFRFAALNSASVRCVAHRAMAVLQSSHVRKSLEAPFLCRIVTCSWGIAP